MSTKEAKDLQPGDVYVHAGMSRFVVISVTPIGYAGSRVEVSSHQVGKPENKRVEDVPSNASFAID